MMYVPIPSAAWKQGRAIDRNGKSALKAANKYFRLILRLLIGVDETCFILQFALQDLSCSPAGDEQGAEVCEP